VLRAWAEASYVVPPGVGILGLPLRFIALSWLANLIALWVVAWIFSGVTYDGFSRLVVAGAIFGVLNTVLKPFLLLLTLPLAIVTLGLAWFGVAMLMLHLTDAILRGFDIHGWWTLAGATVVVWLVNMALANIGPWRREQTGLA
jgi:putative membrane protein